MGRRWPKNRPKYIEEEEEEEEEGVEERKEIGRADRAIHNVLLTCTMLVFIVSQGRELRNLYFYIIIFTAHLLSYGSSMARPVARKTAE